MLLGAFGAQFDGFHRPRQFKVVELEREQFQQALLVHAGARQADPDRHAAAAVFSLQRDMQTHKRPVADFEPVRRAGDGTAQYEQQGRAVAAGRGQLQSQLEALRRLPGTQRRGDPSFQAGQVTVQRLTEAPRPLRRRQAQQIGHCIKSATCQRLRLVVVQGQRGQRERVQFLAHRIALPACRP